MVRKGPYLQAAYLYSLRKLGHHTKRIKSVQISTLNLLNYIFQIRLVPSHPVRAVLAPDQRPLEGVSRSRGRWSLLAGPSRSGIHQGEDEERGRKVRDIFVTESSFMTLGVRVLH